VSETLVSSGGFSLPPTSTSATTFRLFHDTMPVFSAMRGSIDFSPPHVRWARQRERELRATAKMWDWPRPPA
jgi:hypothetical protein